MSEELHDLFIVGGGINGAGIAADAAGRGLKVFLCEKNDLASATSSWSTKLIHGGLRYLEHYEFRLVREALAEREVLLKKAPHIIKPLRFVLPHRPHLRPAWLIRCGLFLYDNIGGPTCLPKSNYLKLDVHNPLIPEIDRGFDYYDCSVDDARLVVLNALDAQQKGATIANYTECVSARRDNDTWLAELKGPQGNLFKVRAKTLVNASGPWAQSFIEDRLDTYSPRRIRLIKGSHMIVKRLYEGDHAYILQNEDKRIVFVIPYHRNFSLIGTTDREYEGEPQNAAIDDYEKKYLLEIVNKHFQQKLSLADILFDYSGVRPLCDDESSDPSAITRDYTLEIQDSGGQAPLLSVFGGKITTYRKLAEAAMEKLKPFFPNMHPGWTDLTPLPGGDIQPGNLENFLIDEYPWIPIRLANRYVHTYGSLCLNWLKGAKQLSDLGEEIIPDLRQAEYEHLVKAEWAKTAEDILWRRTKLGLWRTAEEATKLQNSITPNQSTRFPLTNEL